MEKKLRKKLKSAPPESFVSTGVFVLLAAALAVFLISRYQLREFVRFTTSHWYALAVAAFLVIMIVKDIAVAVKFKKTGRETLKYLEENGLYDDAVQEYCGYDRTECRSKFRSSTFGRAFRRSSVLTENFVFAMNENIVVPYSEIGSAGIIRESDYSSSGSRRNRRIRETLFDIVYIRLCDGRRIDLHSVKEKKYTDEQKRKVEEIFARIRKGKPTCDIDISVAKEYISLPEMQQEEN